MSWQVTLAASKVNTVMYSVKSRPHVGEVSSKHVQSRVATEESLHCQTIRIADDDPGWCQPVHFIPCWLFQQSFIISPNKETHTCLVGDMLRTPVNVAIMTFIYAHIAAFMLILVPGPVMSYILGINELNQWTILSALHCIVTQTIYFQYCALLSHRTVYFQDWQNRMYFLVTWNFIFDIEIYFNIITAELHQVITVVGEAW